MFKKFFSVKKSRPVRRSQPSRPRPQRQETTWREVAPPKKGKRDKRGYHRFNYYGVSGSEFMTAMRTGKYRGEKISRKGSSISEFTTAGRPLTMYSVASKIPKKDRIVM